MINKSVLIVDDSRNFKDRLEKFLVNKGHTVYTAANGIEGISKMRTLKPALVFLDIIMPEMDGMEVLEKVKSDPMLQNIPIIFLSVVENDVVMKEALRLGATGYFIKADCESDIEGCYKKLQAFLKEEDTI